MGLFHLGTTGEAPSLSHRLRKEIMTLTLEQVEKKVPVLVGRTDTSFAESINIREESTLIIFSKDFLIE